MKRLILLCLLVFPLAGQNVQSPARSAGLDRIDQRTLPLDDAYAYNETGLDTVIYIVDTGVNEVEELRGRILHRASTVYNDTANVADCPGAGHGTSVAVIAAGSTLGVAKRAGIVSIRAMPCSGNATCDPSGGWCNLIEAFKQIGQLHRSGQYPRRGVVNLSLADQSGTSRTDVNSELAKLVADGLTVVSATGNHTDDPCTMTINSIGVTEGIITVGSAEPRTDHVSGSTGPRIPGPTRCVEIFAPTDVPTVNASNTAVERFAGTSASAPFVSGVAALAMEKYGLTNAPAKVEDIIQAHATIGVLNDAPAENNRLLFWVTVPVTVGAPVYAGSLTSASIAPVPMATNYQWTIDGGTIVSGQGTTAITYRAGCVPASGVRVEVTTPQSTRGGHAWAPVIRPSVAVSGSANINYGASVNIHLALTGTAPWRVTWSDGFIQTVNSSPAVRSVSPTATTTYRALGVTDANSCAGTTSGSATITVNGCAPASATISTAPTNFSSGRASASVPVEAGATYEWSIVNGTLLTQGSDRVSYLLGCSGTTTLNVKVTRSCGAQSTGSAPVSIVRPTANVYGSTTINAGETALVAAKYTGTLPWSVTWSDGYQEFNINSEFAYHEVTPSETTTYTVIDVRDSKWCPGTATGSATINVQ